MTKIITQNKLSISFALHSVGRVKEICKPLTEYLGIRFFGYMKLYNDCSYLLLHNGYNDFIRKHMETIRGQDAHFKNEFRNTLADGPNFFLWPIKYKTLSPISSLHDEFNIWHGFSINYRHPEYIEHFAFAFNKNADDKSHFYLQNASLLAKFCDYFKIQVYDLIDCANKNKLAIYEDKFDISCLEKIEIKRKEFFDEINKPNNRQLINQNGDLIKLTKREADCMSIFMQNRTIKEIGKHLELSPRTVERYIENVKQKLGVNYKSQLVDIFSNISKV